MFWVRPEEGRDPETFYSLDGKESPRRDNDPKEWSQERRRSPSPDVVGEGLVFRIPKSFVSTPCPNLTDPESRDLPGPRDRKLGDNPRRWGGTRDTSGREEGVPVDLRDTVDFNSPRNDPVENPGPTQVGEGRLVV